MYESVPERARTECVALVCLSALKLGNIKYLLKLYLFVSSNGCYVYIALVSAQLKREDSLLWQDSICTIFFLLKKMKKERHECVLVTDRLT